MRPTSKEPELQEEGIVVERPAALAQRSGFTGDVATVKEATQSQCRWSGEGYGVPRPEQ